MKVVLFILVILLATGIGSSLYYLNISGSNPTGTTEQTESSPVVQEPGTKTTLTGTVLKATGDDYQHIIISGGKSTGIASQTISLDNYVTKKVSVTGQYSGTTLYVDTVEEK